MKNVFHSFTRQSLKKNRSRTIVTIIGILLSMALLTAVIQAVNSGLSYLRRSETLENGSYHGIYKDIPADELVSLLQNDVFKKTASTQLVGWAKIDTKNKYKPYLLVESMSDNYTDLVAVRLLNGRMPENENEIILPAHLRYNGDLNWTTGDTITLDLGRRISHADQTELSASTFYGEENSETIVNTTKKTYTVVGIYDRPDYSIETINSPGYTALTVGGGTGSYNLFFTIAHPSRYYPIMNAQDIPYERADHSDLLVYSGSFRNGGLTQMLYGLVAILVFLITFGSISLIYNSFSISVSERTRQFGILKSVGATRKQIRHTVFYEALLLSAVGIPLGALVGCIGIGITLWLLRDSFTFLASAGVQMRLEISVPGLFLAAVVCLITTLISAWVPAVRAVKIPPIEAIRQTKDVRIREKNVRVGRLTQKLFHFEGVLAVKNFKRNKKRYRSTIFSLFLSIVLFISASSFCSYLMDAVQGVAGTAGWSGPDILFQTEMPDDDTMKQALRDITELSSVDSCVAYRSRSVDIAPTKDMLSSDVWTLPEVIRPYQLEDGSWSLDSYIRVFFLDEDSFRSLCESNNLNPEDFVGDADGESPSGIALNHRQITVQDQTSGELHWYSFDLLNASALPLTIPVRDIPEEGSFPESLSVKAVISEQPSYMTGSSTLYIAYPLSAYQVLFPDASEAGDDSFESTWVYYSILAENHTEAADAIQQICSKYASQSAGYSLTDYAAEYESQRTMVLVLQVFAYGFITLISLIAAANVFNTISTNVALRRREFAMLRSVGLSNRGLRRMMNLECLIYGSRSLLFGLPTAFLITYAIYLTVKSSLTQRFYVPWYSVVIAVGSVFAVVFATMLYASGKIRKDDPVEALKNENL